MPRISETHLLSRVAERLAGQTRGPTFVVVRDASEPQGVAPPSDAGEEVTLRITGKIICSDFPNVAGVNIAIGDDSAADKFPEPGNCLGFKLIVVNTLSHVGFVPRQ
jgi:hypothetical protein